MPKKIAAQPNNQVRQIAVPYLHHRINFDDLGNAGMLLREAGKEMLIISPGRIGYNLYKELGSGAAGSVWLAQNSTGEWVAVKKIEKPKNNPKRSEIVKKEVETEVKVHATLGQFVFKDESEEFYWIGMKLAEGLELSKLYYRIDDKGMDVSIKPNLSLLQQLYIMKQIVKRVADLHKAKVDLVKGLPLTNRMLHLDLKPQNMVIGRDLSIRLIDFGFVLPIANKAGEEEITLPVSRGTMPYSSPESLEEGVYGEKSEVYALGKVFMAMLGIATYYQDKKIPTGKDANGKNTYAYRFYTVSEMISSGKYNEKLKNVDPDLLDLMNRMTSEDPKKRPTVNLVYRKLNQIMNYFAKHNMANPKMAAVSLDVFCGLSDAEKAAYVANLKSSGVHSVVFYSHEEKDSRGVLRAAIEVKRYFENHSNIHHIVPKIFIGQSDIAIKKEIEVIYNVMFGTDDAYVVSPDGHGNVLPENNPAPKPREDDEKAYFQHLIGEAIAAIKGQENLFERYVINTPENLNVKDVVVYIKAMHLVDALKTNNTNHIYDQASRLYEAFQLPAYAHFRPDDLMRLLKTMIESPATSSTAAVISDLQLIKSSTRSSEPPTGSAVDSSARSPKSPRALRAADLMLNPDAGKDARLLTGSGITLNTTFSKSKGKEKEASPEKEVDSSQFSNSHFPSNKSK